MHIASVIAQSMAGEVPKSAVKKMYEVLVLEIAAGLKKERRVRLPGIGILSVRYRPPKAKRKGRPNKASMAGAARVTCSHAAKAAKVASG